MSPIAVIRTADGYHVRVRSRRNRRILVTSEVLTSKRNAVRNAEATLETLGGTETVIEYLDERADPE